MGVAMVEPSSDRLRFQSPATGERPRPQAIADLHLGRAQHRLRRAARPFDLDQRVRLLGPGAQDPARPAVVDARRDDCHAIGEQR